MAIALENIHWSRQHLANAVFHPVTGKSMEYTALMKNPRLKPLWKRGFGNKYGRLLQGMWDVAGTDTCFFIKLTYIPKDRKIAYGKIVCGYKPHEKENERVRLTVGGDILDYSCDIATSTADITTFKILITSTLSTDDSTMMTMDTKNYYLGTPLPRFEYIKMLLSRFPKKNHPKVQPQRISRRRLGTHRNSRGHVRLKTSGTPLQSITTNSTSTFWILSDMPHTRTLVT
jgi:hypothetical protein